MDPIFWLCVGGPILFAFIVRVVRPDLMSITEVIVQGTAASLFTLVIWLSFQYSGTWDREVWNGSISATIPEQRNCQQGWSRSKDSFCTDYDTRQVYSHTECASRDEDGKCTSTRDVYETEYRYNFPWERRYFIQAANLNNSQWEIRRIDRQGVNYPPRFSQTRVGDPASITNGYSNWIKGAAGTLFHQDGVAEDKYAGFLPQYPLEIFDIYRINRILTVGDTGFQVTAQHERMLSDALSTLGPERQMNAIFVLVDAKVADPDYQFALQRYWEGFKKNDAVVFVGLDAGKVVWSDTLSWSKESRFDIEMREAMATLIGQPMNMRVLTTALKENGMKWYERRSMKEFEYLKGQIPTPLWLIILCLVISTGISGGLFVVFLRIDFDPIGEAIASSRNGYRFNKFDGVRTPPAPMRNFNTRSKK